MRKRHIIIIGAGLAGSVCARQLADADFQVLLLDKRNHVGGNVFDHVDESGVLVQKYGPHIFHTNSDRIFRWLSRFTHWRFYEHRVLASVDGQYLPFPINRSTINSLYGLNLSDVEIENFLSKRRVAIASVQTSEDLVLATVGHDLCEKFYRGYTLKQWGLDLSQLSVGVAARIPVRTNDDDRYFSDVYQMMPLNGFTAMINNMLDHPNIRVQIETDYKPIRRELCESKVIYTGSIDEFYDYQFGKLPYRSLYFEHRYIPNCKVYQSVGTINFPNDHGYTRVTEFKHLTGQAHSGTSIVYEYPQSHGEKYYPIPTEKNQKQYLKYRELSELESNIFFVGRLAQYRYFNMDQVIASALKVVEKIASL